MTPEEHNRTLGILHLVYGGIHGLVTLAMAVFFFIFAGMMLNAPGNNADASFLVAVMAIVMLISFIFTIPSFVAGYGLMKRKQWAKLWGIIAGVMAGMSFPLGTALCIYTIWFLVGDAARDVYADAQAGRSQKPREALYGAPPPAGWAARYTTGEQREHEYAPPTGPPNWRD